MKIKGDWLSHAGTQALCKALEQAGHQALLVGGCVRNALLGTAVADIDIATDALPQQVMELVQQAGLKAIPTGIEHGTVTVLAKGRAHEVTTFRRDVETDGRHAKVAFSDNLAEDASRRDFTMNALYARADGRVIDPLGGLPDLRARHVRFVGDPAARITEDYLRILRFFRFCAWYADPAKGSDPDALAAIAEHAEGLARISKERIGAEMRKLLGAPDPSTSLAQMQACGVLRVVLPGADPRAIAPLVHLEGHHPPHWLRRLAALGGETAAEDLRLSRHDQRTLGLLQQGGQASATEMAWRHGAELAMDATMVLHATLGQELPPNWQFPLQRAASARFPVKSADLIPHLQGPDLGRALRMLEKSWIASDFTLSREDLLAQVTLPTR